MSNKNHKQKLVWILSLIVIFIIFIVWSFFILQGKILKNKLSPSSNNFLEEFSNNLTNTWNSFKIDVLKLKETTEEKETEEEKTRKLKESVYPDFDQYR